MADPDDPRSTSSLADDPGFLARLNDLDEGLGGEEPRRGSEATSVRGARVARAVLAPAMPARDAESLEPLPALAFTAPVESASRQAPRDALPAHRPLLDLFPPALHDPADPVPIPGPAVGPRLAAGRRAVRHVAPPPADATPTYQTFYGLTEPPFDLSTDPKFLYSSASHERVAQRLLTAIRRQDGFALVTGPPGVGKTTACRAVIEQLDRRTLTSLPTSAVGSIEDLLLSVLIDFGVVSRDEVSRAPASRDALIATLRAFLASLSAVEATALVFIDEAQQIPSETLAELPRLAGPDGASGLLQMVIVGQPSLLARLRRTELRDLAQCLAVRCSLEPLAPDEVLGYVVHRLSVAGGSSRVEFDEAAVRRLHLLSGGTPRTINHLCDRALVLGARLSASVIDARLVDAAADELGVSAPVARSRVVARGVAVALLLFALGLLGAAGAAWIFRARVARSFVQWTQVPRAPDSPAPELAVPLTPRSAPEGPGTQTGPLPRGTAKE